ncbi:MAG: diacylglycerol kinase [Miltoncostaeaceae bacterium]
MSAGQAERPAPPVPPTPPPGGTLARQGSLRWSFTWAFEGIVYVLRTQRNMQIHVGAAAVALTAGLLLDFSRLEMAIILAAVSLVLVAEMVNTAIEATIDAVITTYHPLVKVAKDVAAGAVLVATVNALAVGDFIFYEHLTDTNRDLLVGVRRSPNHLVVVTLILTVIAAIAVKAHWQRTHGRGTPLRGGMPSAHAAAAFAAWMALTIIAEPLTHAALVSSLAFMMALLVAQSRVEAGIHSAAEVAVGAFLGAGIAILVFQLWG